MVFLEIKTSTTFAAGYYDLDEDILDDVERAALVPLEDSKVLCLKCNKTLAHMASARRHYVARHQQNKNARCQICSKVYKNVDTRNAHMYSFHKVSVSMMKKAVTMPSDNVGSF